MTETRDRIRARAKALGANEEQFRDQLFALRRAHGLSQGVVAERMGVSQSVIARLERYDSNPTLSTLRRYALAVEARLDFTATSDRDGYVMADHVDVSPMTTSAVPTTPSLDWSALKVDAHA